MEKKYNPQDIENRIYQYWLDHNLFQGQPELDKPRFTIILPPPNVTGQLHLGHAWDGTLQDVLVRYHRLQGFDAVLIPGMDHAGIATQVKVMERLKAEKNLNLKDLTKKSFLEYAWKWKEEYASIIRSQWAKVGLGLDYSREKFTLDKDIAKTVNELFVQLYNEGIIYEGYKIVNFDMQLQTAISNVEVNYRETKGKLYYLKYYLKDKSAYLTVATTRPETMFADQAVIVNSKDQRYEKMIGQLVINPANGLEIKVIGDDYVDMDFGTGAMKCTPAHDINDYTLGLKYKLAMPLCMTESGIMNDLAKTYQGQDRFLCRKNLIKDLEKQGLVEKIEDYTHQVGFSEKTDTVVEPYLSKQWFVKMQDFASQILETQKNIKNKVNFFPSNFEEQMNHWLKSIQDWCISRQLWWGHPLPVWYHKSTKKIYVGIKAPDNAQDYMQSSDVLDTWFSSCLWPFVSLNWNTENNSDFKKYYPVSVLVTAYDILFFWVVRMMIMGQKFTNQNPFKNVLIHGLIRDDKGQKMSKSLNNGINPITVIDEHGADALRYFLVSNCSPGQDLRFSKIKIAAAWNLINKLWNAARYVLLHSENNKYQLEDINPSNLQPIDFWILEELNSLVKKMPNNMNKYEFAVATNDLANFIWERYCSSYIELSKVNLQSEKNKSSTLATLSYVLEQILIMLHPFIPFVTEEIYQRFAFGKTITAAKYPKPLDLKNSQNSHYFVETVIALVNRIRDIRQTENFANKIALELHLVSDSPIYQSQWKAMNEYLLILTNAQIISVSSKSLTTKQKITRILQGAILELATEILIDPNKEQAKITKELAKLELEITKTNELLNNKGFLAKAPKEKIALEQDKLKQYEAQKTLLQTKLK